MSGDLIWAVGRRKSSTARAKLTKGSGNLTINRVPVKEYFHRERDINEVLKPLKETKKMEEYDLQVFVKGGGHTGQAGAIMLAISRALVKAEPELEEQLRKKGLLTRDARVKERKKYGLRGARRSFQFSKR
ncbi:MAG: 30S ribosomal protein S9 [Planctomycetota bacterium]|nr:MAG: 30S ribosomal protein S9 [Planctomycetota bacterium]